MLSPESENYPKWQNLLPELLSAIVKRLTSIDDFISFRGVCRSWRSAATFDNFDTELPRLPWLMYPAKRGERDEKEVVKMWDVETNTHKITNFPPIYHSPPLSCFGWTLSVKTMSPDVSLRHFLLPISIRLPDMEPSPLIWKMVLSGSPMKSGCVVMVIWGRDSGLAFCRPGDESWTEIAVGVEPFSNFFDIIYHNRKLYAVDCRGTTIYECDIHGPNPTSVVQVFAFDEVMRELVNWKSYLVESHGKLLIVSRNHAYVGTNTKLWVFEIDLKDGSVEEICDLGDMSLFLGTNSSICVEILKFESLKVKPGHIYFTNTFTVWTHPNEGVYRLSDGHYENLGIFGFTSSVVDLYNWVVPSI